ncbi:hypothetical protein HXA35_20565 [Bacillus sp. A301a_S52]|jgi:hypothetical protein|nr:hypothetical protein [Bacillus sp. A301a_S52]
MAKRKIKVTPGQNYSHLTVIKEIDPVQYGKYKTRMVLCVCECGKEREVRLEYLRSGHTKSCGCILKELSNRIRKTHGLTGTRLYRIWSGMKARCYNKNRKSYKTYGALGVSVCEEWKDFEPFYKWAMNNGYKSNLTIERIDPYGNYEPSNCTWIPFEEQAKNKRSKV